MLDANAFILLLTGHSTIVARISQCDDGDIALSAISFGEVALGSLRGRPPTPEIVDRVVSRFAILEFDEAAARCYARMALRRASFDRLIGAHALAAGLTLVTANIGDFSDISGLLVEDWTQ